MATIDKTGIVDGQILLADHIVRIIDALDGTSADTVVATGSFSGDLQGTAATASYTPNAIVTASVSSNEITFTKGDGSTFPIIVDTGSGWSLTGDAGTVDGTNFIGTTNNIPFSIRVNNRRAGRIDSTLQNTFFGYQAGNSITSGSINTANGYQSLFSNTTGYENTAIGGQSLTSNTEGSQNTALGYGADVSVSNLANTTAIGNGATVNSSNTVQLGNSSIVAVYSSGNNIIRNPTLSAINETATATAAQIISGYITSTSAAATTITLPKAADILTAIGGSAARGTSLCFTVDNEGGANTVTIAVTAISGITSHPSSALTTSTDEITSLFRLVFTTDTTAILIRVY